MLLDFQKILKKKTLSFFTFKARNILRERGKREKETETEKERRRDI